MAEVLVEAADLYGYPAVQQKVRWNVTIRFVLYIFELPLHDRQAGVATMAW